MTAADLTVASLYPYIPYCGAPPVPADIWRRWNLDPLLIAALLAPLIAYAIGARLGRDALSRPTARRQALFYGGWILGAAALVSPLCPLSVALFSARVGQHMLLTTIVAPLLALSRPGSVMGAGLARLIPIKLRPIRSPSPLIAAGLFAAALWFWHAPAPYTATFQSDVAYWLMHLTTFAAAYALWAALLDRASDRLAGFVAATFLTTGQMGLLGAVITFAGRPLYPPHQLTTAAWGLSPLADQQLGGVIMWVPAGGIFVAAMVFAFIQALGRADQRATARTLA
jgi:putative membrane protein